MFSFLFRNFKTREKEENHIWTVINVSITMQIKEDEKANFTCNSADPLWCVCDSDSGNVSDSGSDNSNGSGKGKLQIKFSKTPRQVA